MTSTDKQAQREFVGTARPQCPNTASGLHWWELVTGRYDTGPFHTLTWRCIHCDKTTLTSARQPAFGKTDTGPEYRG